MRLPSSLTMPGGLIANGEGRILFDLNQEPQDLAYLNERLEKISNPAVRRLPIDLETIPSPDSTDVNGSSWRTQALPVVKSVSARAATHGGQTSDRSGLGGGVSATYRDFFIQCEICGKSRYIDQQRYNELVLESRFFCSMASYSCEDKEEDPPAEQPIASALQNVHCTVPDGWKGAVYKQYDGINAVRYYSPCGDILQSSAEMEQYLMGKPQFAHLSVDDFCFSADNVLRDSNRISHTEGRSSGGHFSQKESVGEDVRRTDRGSQTGEADQTSANMSHLSKPKEAKKADVFKLLNAKQEHAEISRQGPAGCDASATQTRHHLTESADKKPSCVRWSGRQGADSNLTRKEHSGSDALFALLRCLKVSPPITSVARAAKTTGVSQAELISLVPVLENFPDLHHSRLYKSLRNLYSLPRTNTVIDVGESDSEEAGIPAIPDSYCRKQSPQRMCAVQEAGSMSSGTTSLMSGKKPVAAPDAASRGPLAANQRGDGARVMVDARTPGPPVVFRSNASEAMLGNHSSAEDEGGDVDDVEAAACVRTATSSGANRRSIMNDDRRHSLGMPRAVLPAVSPDGRGEGAGDITNEWKPHGTSSSPEFRDRKLASAGPSHSQRSLHEEENVNLRSHDKDGSHLEDGEGDASSPFTVKCRRKKRKTTVVESDDDMSGSEQSADARDSDSQNAPGDWICIICDDGGNLTQCDGCDRCIHLTGESACVEATAENYEGPKGSKAFYCNNCVLMQHQCNICGKLGRSGPIKGCKPQVVRCSMPYCGHFYHLGCLGVWKSKESGRSLIMRNGSIVCPLHYCYVCSQKEDSDDAKNPLVQCRRCPRAYHLDCVPKNIMYSKGTRRIWGVREEEVAKHEPMLLYCLKHPIKDGESMPARCVTYPDL